MNFGVDYAYQDFKHDMSRVFEYDRYAPLMITGTELAKRKKERALRMNTPHNVEIKKVLNGFIVIVGCQTLVFERKDAMISELSMYLDDPDATEKRYMDEYRPNTSRPLEAPSETACSNYPHAGMDVRRP